MNYYEQELKRIKEKFRMDGIQIEGLEPKKEQTVKDFVEEKEREKRALLGLKMAVGKIVVQGKRQNWFYDIGL